jgi:hypothetical protein
MRTISVFRSAGRTLHFLSSSFVGSAMRTISVFWAAIRTLHHFTGCVLGCVVVAGAFLLIDAI